MKKVFYAFVLLAAVAVAFSSCKKDDNKDDNKIVKRLTQCGDQWDVYVFSYDSDGKIAKVNRNEGEKVWTFNWTENKAAYAEKKSLDHLTGNQKCSWLLRTPGIDEAMICYVQSEGEIRHVGGNVNAPGSVVRPAIWLKIKF